MKYFLACIACYLIGRLIAHGLDLGQMGSFFMGWVSFMAYAVFVKAEEQK